VKGDSKPMKCIQVAINDTIRSLFRLPLITAIKCILAESGCIPMAIEWRYLQRKYCRRALVYGYGKEYPWFGTIHKEWNPTGFIESDEEQTNLISASLQVIIGSDKQQGMENHDRIVKELSTEAGIRCVYMDDSRTKGRNALGWTWATADATIDGSSWVACTGDLHIVCCEMAAIGCALTDGSNQGIKNITVFSDCKPALMRLDRLRFNDHDMFIHWAMYELMNLYERITLVWVPGHSGIAGNCQADRMATRMIGTRIDYDGWEKWRALHQSNGGLEQDTREREVHEWCKKEGHEYYKRKLSKPVWMKGLSRLDYYVFYRVRTGSDKIGHESCTSYDDRFHLIKCPKYKNTPPINTLFKDKHVIQWLKWIRENDYLNMGIPTTMIEQLDTRVVYGNPFNHTITIERNGLHITEQTPMKGCDGCSFSHSSECLKRISTLKGKWFFCPADETKCPICRGNFGGGNNDRPGGLGL